jgi:hypothetical protein
MSALKHGLFKVGFMLCDRCTMNAKCEHFKPGDQCFLETEAFGRLVSDLIEEFDLESMADRIMVERAAMYLIRIARAEVYEVTVGVTEKSASWGTYINRLDNTLRGLFNDLAMTRAKRKKLEKDEALLVSVDEVLKKFAKAEVAAKKARKMTFEKQDMLISRKKLLLTWRKEYSKMRLTLRRGKIGQEGKEKNP